MQKNPFQLVTQPTLLLNEEQARRNIASMAAKTRAQGIHFRPHFKTHQSAEIGTWFRKEGVKSITVSSVSMAKYFASHGWKDITIAFPFNWREMDDLNSLVDHNHIELLIESVETARFLQEHLHLLTEVWIKVDVGAHRAGIDWQDGKSLQALINTILECKKLILRGLLTHDGRTYHANSVVEIQSLYRECISRVKKAAKSAEPSPHFPLEISVGDTPGCWLSEDLGGVNEVRPGNFVFFDVWQYQLGVCTAKEMVVAVACPVVAKHSDRSEVIIYGGAIHLSKEYLLQNGIPHYGMVAFPGEGCWGVPEADCYVSALYQEHGIVKLSSDAFNRVQVGDCLCILPVHSCLTVDCLGYYLTLDGRWIQMMKKG
jgi:D-serine deaminase-like pyridoxal phosphate-dependent protein